MVTRFLVDTNVWIHYLKGVNTIVESRLRSTPAEQITVCSVIWAELLHGAEKYALRDARVAKVVKTLAPYHSFEFGNSTAPHYADIRHRLELAGGLVGPHDIMIASIAREHGLTVVSSDAGFRQIPGLLVEDWTVS